jgi:hypothetical protein
MERHGRDEIGELPGNPPGSSSNNSYVVVDGIVRPRLTANLVIGTSLYGVVGGAKYP